MGDYENKAKHRDAVVQLELTDIKGFKDRQFEILP
jgi:hypothetical protein